MTIKLAEGDEINISITPKDISHGERQNCQRCPGARAVTRKLRKLGILTDDMYVNVSPFSVNVMRAFKAGGSYVIVEFRSPDAFKKWIWNFDVGCDMKPARFKLQVAWVRPKNGQARAGDV